jgi:hypothetical protein
VKDTISRILQEVKKVNDEAGAMKLSSTDLENLFRSVFLHKNRKSDSIKVSTLGLEVPFAKSPSPSI